MGGPEASNANVVRHPSTIASLAASWAALRTLADDMNARVDLLLDEVDRRAPPPVPFMSREEAARRDETARNLTWPRPQGSPRLEAYDEWKSASDAAYADLGVTALNDATYEAYATATFVRDQLLALRPASIGEAAMKFAVVLSLADWESRTGPLEFAAAGPLLAMLDDLEHLAKIAAA